MKRLSPSDRPTVRETCALYRRRPLVLVVQSHSVLIGEKGRRRKNYYEVPLVAIYSAGAKLKAAEARRLRKEARG